LIDSARAGDVDDPQARLGLEQQVPPDQTGGLRGLGQVDREEVRLGDDLVQRHQLDATLTGLVGRHERVVGDEAHPEPAGPVGDELADAPKADDAERLVGEFDPLPFAPLPPAGDQRGMGLGNVASLRQQEGHRVLGRRHNVRLRRVDHHHASLRGGVDIDVVEADTGPTHDNQVRG
jgi:hypothetical protein